MLISVGLTDFVKRGVFILVDGIPHYRNYHFFSGESVAGNEFPKLLTREGKKKAIIIIPSQLYCPSGKMVETGCEVICGAPATPAVKGYLKVKVRWGNLFGSNKDTNIKQHIFTYVRLLD